MSRDEIEKAYTVTIDTILESIGNTTAAHVNILDKKAIEVTINSLEQYLKMMKDVQVEYEKPGTNQSCLSPMLNDSMLVHRNRLSRTSKSRLTYFRNSPDGQRGSPMEVDRQGTSVGHIPAIAEESTIYDPTIIMEETIHQRGFLADVSDMDGTVRSRHPSFNFNYLSPVASNRTRQSSIGVINSTIDFDADTSSMIDSSKASTRFNRLFAGHENDSIVVVDDEELRTPKTANTTINLTDIDVTPTMKLWNVKLRSGSNRKIDNEIRKEIQRQLARDIPSL